MKGSSSATAAALSPAGSRTLKIGIAKDEAFNFYYQDDLDYFNAENVELVTVSPLHGTWPDNLDGFFIGGGFPERHASTLSRNTSFLEALKISIEAGMPVHAECGGLMYLCKTLTTQEHGSNTMVGVFDAEVTMRAKPVGRGYMQLSRMGKDDETLWTHEFHHSEIQFDSDPEFVYRVKRGHGVDGNFDGIKVLNVIASYAHFRHTEATPWIDWFLSRVYEHQQLDRHVQSH